MAQLVVHAGHPRVGAEEPPLDQPGQHPRGDSIGALDLALLQTEPPATDADQPVLAEPAHGPACERARQRRDLPLVEGGQRGAQARLPAQRFPGDRHRRRVAAGASSALGLERDLLGALADELELERLDVGLAHHRLAGQAVTEELPDAVQRLGRVLEGLRAEPRVVESGRLDDGLARLALEQRSQPEAVVEDLGDRGRQLLEMSQVIFAQRDEHLDARQRVTQRGPAGGGLTGRPHPPDQAGELGDEGLAMLG